MPGKQRAAVTTAARSILRSDAVYLQALLDTCDDSLKGCRDRALLLFACISTFLSMAIPPAALHRLIKYGVAGFIGNVLTGICFLSGAPDQYIYNWSFRWKLVFLTVAGLNILVFYSSFFRRVRDLGEDEAIPVGARVVGAVSICCWIGVITAGRLLTFYRPYFADGKYIF